MLSVVIPALDAERTLGQQLDAILQQDFSEPFEVVVADNGSGDATAALVERYRGHDSRIRLVNASDCNRGAGPARNAGVEAAAGDTIVFCDADDVVQPGWLSAMAKGLRVHPVVMAKRGYWLLNSRAARDVYPQYRVDEHFLDIPTIASGAFGIHREVYDTLGGFDEDFRVAEDTEFGLRLHRHGVPPPVLVDAVVECRVPTKPMTMFGRHRRLARARPRLVTMYPEVPRGDVRMALRATRRLIRQAPMLRTESGRFLWLRWAGEFVGQVEGCIHHRQFVWS